MNLSTKKGFTLIELLIVVAILGLLAAIAIPVYSKYRNNAYRSSAKAELVEGVQNMERYFIRNHTYVGAALDVQVTEWTDGNKYQLSFANDATTFTITATPQYVDKCGNLSINNIGVKTPANCW